MADRLAPLGYYKWHWQTWRANRKVQRMNYIERGLYRELLDECWAEGFIPDDVEKLADICGCPVDVMANAWQVLSKCFANAGNGFLYNERLEQERTEMDKTRANRARAGAAGGRAKASNGAASDGNSLANASKCQANASKSHIEEKRREEKEEKNKRTPKADAFGVLQILQTFPTLDESVAKDFISHRKAKRAPLTQSAWDAIAREIMSSGWTPDKALREAMARGWQGFKADWVAEKPQRINGKHHEELTWCPDELRGTQDDPLFNQGSVFDAIQ